MEPQRQAFNLLDRMIRRLRSRRIARYVLPGSAVLDFGCGRSNWFLNASARTIARGVGVDPNAPSYGGVDDAIISFHGTLGDYTTKHPGQQFDLITWLAVVEHLLADDALDALRLSRTLLIPGGRLVMTTPTPRARPVLEFLAYRLKVISGDEIRDHKLYYDQRLLCELLIRAGFTVTSYERFQLGMNSIAIATPGVL